MERPAQLFYASKDQINMLIPAATAPGKTTVTVTNPGGDSYSIITTTSDVAPGLFTAKTNGTGVAAGQIARLKANGTNSVEPLAAYDADGNIVPVPIEFRGDTLALVLYGTGLRNAQTARQVTATIDGQPVPILYIGPQPIFAGLDQVNLGMLPQSLAGRGEVEVKLMVDGIPMNTVTVMFR